MTNPSFNLSGKIDPLLVEVLGVVSRVAAEKRIPFFIVGATARDLVLDHCHAIPAIRATRDLDIGIKVAGWQEYRLLSEALLATGRFAAVRQPHVLMWGAFEINIVPFGSISPDSKSISWPPDHAVIMNILGFQDAYEYAMRIQLHESPELTVRVPTIPGMALMKIISWNDGYPHRSKDAQDLLFLMDHYADAGNEDRIFTQESALMEAEGFDLDLAAIRLLGRDMAAIAFRATGSEVMSILFNECDDLRDPRLIRDMLGKSIFAGERFGEIRRKLVKLRQGFQERFENFTA